MAHFAKQKPSQNRAEIFRYPVLPWLILLMIPNIPRSQWLHGGEHLRKSPQRVTFRAKAESVIVAIYDRSLGR